MQQKKYKIVYTYSSRDDIRKMKKYILEQFKYRELGENFTQKIKEAVRDLEFYPVVIIQSIFNIEDMTFI